jgi:hypothetical protein
LRRTKIHPKKPAFLRPIKSFIFLKYMPRLHLLRDDSESKSVINKTFCGHRLHWFKKIKSDLLLSNAEWNYNREQEKSKYLDNTFCHGIVSRF